jgi:D-amino-acid dehydrogenase
MSNAPPRDAIVIGAGIVGLAVAQRLLGEGMAVTIVDRDPAGDKASLGNAGGIAVTEVVPASVPGLAWRVPGWLLDPLGPLALRPAHAAKLVPWLWRFARAGKPAEVSRIAHALAALNGRVYDDLLPMLAAAGLSGELHRNGALTVYESEAGFQRDAAEWALKRAHGITVENLTAEEARAMEPALGPIVTRAVFTPQWSDVSDPKRIVDGLRAWLLAQGATILAGEVVDVHGGDRPGVTLADGRRLAAGRVIVAAGAWSGRLAKRLGDAVLIESECGYNTTLPDPGLALSREVIFGERKFVAVSLSCGLRIGGAAEFGGLEAKANFGRSRALVKLASRYLPGLNTQNGREWAGHRPTTPDSLPVIGPSPRQPNVVYAFGHGHLGLTQAATTGRLVADLICGKPAALDLSPYAISRFS